MPCGPCLSALSRPTLPWPPSGISQGRVLSPCSLELHHQLPALASPVSLQSSPYPSNEHQQPRHSPSAWLWGTVLWFHAHRLAASPLLCSFLVSGIWAPPDPLPSRSTFSPTGPAALVALNGISPSADPDLGVRFTPGLRNLHIAVHHTPPQGCLEDASKPTLPTLDPDLPTHFLCLPHQAKVRSILQWLGLAWASSPQVWSTSKSCRFSL